MGSSKEGEGLNKSTSLLRSRCGHSRRLGLPVQDPQKMKSPYYTPPPLSNPELYFTKSRFNWKFNFPMHPHVRLVGRLVCLSVGQSVMMFWREMLSCLLKKLADSDRARCNNNSKYEFNKQAIINPLRHIINDEGENMN